MQEARLEDLRTIWDLPIIGKEYWQVISRCDEPILTTYTFTTLNGKEEKEKSWEELEKLWDPSQE